MKIKKNIKKATVGLLASAMAISGAFAWLTNSETASKQNNISVGTSKVIFEDGTNVINLTDNLAIPMTNEYAVANLTPYTFKVSNRGTVDMEYSLTAVNEDSTTIDPSLVMIQLDGRTPITLAEANLMSGKKIEAGTSDSHSLIAYINEAGVVSNSTNNVASFHLELTAVQASNNSSPGSGSSVSGVETDGSVLINEVNFPNEAFRTYVTKFDTDSDGRLTLDERNAVTDISINNRAITSLKGIEYFTKLRVLECSDSQLTSLDVSKNTELLYLDCRGNQLTNIDVSNNAALKELWCGENPLTTLDISNNTLLTMLNCSDSQLTSLDVSKNTALTELWCDGNQLTTLDLTHNPSLNSSNVQAGSGVEITYAS